MTPDSTAQLRKAAYALLIVATAGIIAGRIMSVQRVIEPTLIAAERWPTVRPAPLPTHGDNDRSRWVTIRALVEEQSYSIGWRQEFPSLGDQSSLEVFGLQVGRLLHSVNPYGTLGPTPPSPPPYRDFGIMTENGWGTIDKILHPDTKKFYSSKPPLLPTILAGEYWLIKKLTGWTLKEQPFEVVRIMLLTVNWLPMVIYLIILARLVEERGAGDWGRLFVMAAACSGTLLNPFLTTLNNHTIAACGVMFALYPFIQIWYGNQTAWWRFALAGFFAAWAACNELPAASFAAAVGGLLLIRYPRQTLLFLVPAAALPVAAFLWTNYLAIGQWLPAYERFGTPWYEFPGSFWANKRGIDAANEPKWLYAFHLLLGHHGLFSMTPVFFLSLAGMLLPWLGRNERPAMFALPALTLAIVVVVIGFYIRSTNNYGGWTSGPRWFFWLTPLLLLAMLPIADRMGNSRFGRAAAYVLLAISAFSAAYPAWNPWRPPWAQNLMEWHREAPLYP